MSDGRPRHAREQQGDSQASAMSRTLRNLTEGKHRDEEGKRAVRPQQCLVPFEKTA